LPYKVISGSTKVVDFGINPKCVFDFQLVINLGRILHRYGNTVAYKSKIANSYLPHPHSMPSLGVTPFEFRDEPDISKTGKEIMGRPYGEEIMIVGRTV